MFIIEDEYDIYPSDLTLLTSVTAIYAVDIKFISRRFREKHYLNLSDEQIAENEKLWKEENSDGISNTRRR